jgi:hypothetical protein
MRLCFSILKVAPESGAKVIVNGMTTKPGEMK